jgi:hypothetical protein
MASTTPTMMRMSQSGTGASYVQVWNVASLVPRWD